MMKNFLPVCFIIPVLAVSCTLDKGSSSHRTPETLSKYTSSVLYDWVVNSVSFLDKAIEIDAYLQLTEEERQDPEYGHLAQSLKQKDGNTFFYDDALTIRTGGARLTETGTEWTLELSDDRLYLYMYQNYYRALSDGSYDGSSSDDDAPSVIWTIKCTGNDSWKMTVGGEAVTVSLEADLVRTHADIMEGAEYEGTGYEYNGAVKGSVAEGSDGTSAVFATEGSGFRYYYAPYYVSDSYGSGSDGKVAVEYYHTYSTVFRLDIYRHNELRDWCVLTCTGDGSDYKTSADSL